MGVCRDGASLQNSHLSYQIRKGYHRYIWKEFFWFRWKFRKQKKTSSQVLVLLQSPKQRINYVRASHNVEHVNVHSNAQTLHNVARAKQTTILYFCKLLTRVKNATKESAPLTRWSWTKFHEIHEKCLIGDKSRSVLSQAVNKASIEKLVIGNIMPPIL